MFKRGQITLFVIIAIILIGAVATIVILRTGAIKAPVSAEEAEKIVASQIAPVKDLVTGCIQEPYSDSLKKIGMQGGYCTVSLKNSQLGNYSVPYLVEKSGNDYINNLLLLNGGNATIAKEIDRCIDMEKIMSCIDFGIFKDVTVNPTGELTWETEILPGKIIITVNYPLTISRGDAKATVDEMRLEVKTGLVNAYTAATAITNSEVSSHDFDIGDYSVKNPNKVMISRQGAPEAIYYYITTIPAESEEAYQFNFAVDR